MRQSIVIDATSEIVFPLIDDPSRYPDFFVGVTRWEPRSTRRRGVGARYRVLMRVGSVEAGGIIKISERSMNRSIAWESETGVGHEGRWELEDEDGLTRLSLEIRYDLSGPLGWLVERLTGRIVGRNLWATLMAARRLVESETA
ncbi:MAG: SRPBCC family protein [Actinomycetota bacterium]